MALPQRWNLLNTTFLLGTLLLAVVLVPLHVLRSGHLGAEFGVMAAMFVAIGISIAAGYHRLFSHRAYRASWPVRFLLLCLGAAAFQNSALRWSSDHRIHHRHVDTDRDPYPITKGFWHAHWLWVMDDTSLPLQGVADLEADPLIRWQHRWHFLIGAVTTAMLPLLVGLATGNLWGHLVIGVLLRIVLTHHTTFLINSAAHVFGTQPYTDANTARDNALLAPLTFGEGYHNFHHLWPGDYRNGIYWYQFDAAKWLINGLAWLGMVDKLRTVPEATIQKAKLAMEAKRLARRLAHAHPTVAADLHDRMERARARVEQALTALQAHRDSLRTQRAEWKSALRAHRAEARLAWAEWKATRFRIRQLA